MIPAEAIRKVHSFLYESEAWRTFFVVVWYLWIGFFAAFEAFAIIDKNTASPPLTHVIVRMVPGYITIPFLAWLFIHFTSRYLNYPIL